MNEIAHQGAFKVLESDDPNNDFILTDENELSLLGFTEEEAADIEILMEQI